MSKFMVSYRSTGDSWRSIAKYLGLFVLCLVLAVSCGRSQSNSQSSSAGGAGGSGGRVSIGTTLEIRTIDPADAYEIMPGILLSNLGDRLYTYKPGTTELVPQLATELPKISSDGLTYTIPLRQGVKFHDGTPFNAEAMAFSLNRFMKKRRQTQLFAVRSNCRR